jgi:threonine/homoserine/homoserine lactone efflux protein
MGFLIAFFNPKAILFFVAIFPQFLNNINSDLIYEFIYIFFPIGGVAFICFIIYGICGTVSLKIFKNTTIINYTIKFLGTLLIASAILGILDIVL